jgi:hypothetical protein
MSLAIEISNPSSNKEGKNGGKEISLTRLFDSTKYLQTKVGLEQGPKVKET